MAEIHGGVDMAQVIWIMNHPVMKGCQSSLGRWHHTMTLICDILSPKTFSFLFTVPKKATYIGEIHWVKVSLPTKLLGCGLFMSIPSRKEAIYFMIQTH